SRGDKPRQDPPRHTGGQCPKVSCRKLAISLIWYNSPCGLALRYHHRHSGPRVPHAAVVVRFGLSGGPARWRKAARRPKDEKCDLTNGQCLREHELEMEGIAIIIDRCNTPRAYAA